MNDFLPDGYKVPASSGGYMKFLPGPNKLRFLTKPVMGMELWQEVEKKQIPVRVRKGVSFSKEELLLAKPGQKAKHFWAAVVWDYQEKQVSEIVIPQIKVLRAIAEFCNNEKWGSPLAYDLVITRTGEGKDNTDYIVAPDPKEELAPEIVAEFAKYTVDLEQFFDGGDVLTKNEDEPATEINLDNVPFG